MNRIEKLFKEKRKNIFSVFFTAGFPTLDSTSLIARALEKAGVDLIEIGIPFSDPVADGTTIQESSKIALDNGMSVKILLNQVREIRKEVSVPIILMGYLNPVLQYGFEMFCKDAAENGVDGIILPDLPFDEYNSEYRTIVEKYGILHIFLITPTTSEDRIRKIDLLSTGFIYAISSSSITGSNGDFSKEQEDYFRRLNAMNLKNPFLVGFGISSHQSFYTATEYGAGAIVGSAFIKLLKGINDFNIEIESFVKNIRAGSHKIKQPINL